MTIALDFAQWFDDVADIVDDEHEKVASDRPADGSAGFPTWQQQMNLLHDQYASLSGCAMALRNVDGLQAMQAIEPQLASIQENTQEAQAAIKKIADFNRAVNLVAAFVGVAVAIAALIPDPVGGVGGLVVAGQTLATALGH